MDRDSLVKQYRLGFRDFRRADCFGLSLTHVQLSLINGEGADFGESWLSHADLSKANLRQANFLGARVRSSVMPDVDLQGAYLTGSKVHWTDLRYSNLSGASLCKAEWHQVNLFGAKLNFANLEGAILWDVDLKCAHFQCALVHKTCFRDSSLQAADLSRCHAISRADLQGSFYDHATVFPKKFNPLAAGMIFQAVERYSEHSTRR